MTDDYFKELSIRDTEQKNKLLKEIQKNDPGFVPDGDFYDAHSCKVWANELGECQWCGALVPGSSSYCEAHGCDYRED